MAIKSILVAYSGNAQGSAGLRLALQMARKYQAHLTAVVAHGPALLEAKYGRYMSADVREILHGRDAETVARLRQEFEAKVAAEGKGVAASFLDLRTRDGFTLADTARNYDLVVMGRGASTPGHEHFGARPEAIARESGRPVILVPKDYAAETLVEHALVAWDGGRAAARALADAMHILETKEKVTVLSGNASPPKEKHGDDIADLLGRHGIVTERLYRPADPKGIAATILGTCRETGAGLLVMGAYEHGAVHVMLFGGATNDIMADADLPVLMSH